MVEPSDYVTVEVAASELGVHPESIRRWLRDPERRVFPNALRSPAFKGWRIPRSELEALKQIRG